MTRIASIAAASLLVATGSLAGQAKPAAPAPSAAQQQAAAGITPPADYVIGEGDVLIITYWDQKEMNGDYVVRPDGMITLSLIDDVPAKGLKPEQLRDRLLKLSTMFEDPRITVGIRTINSRKVYISGGIGKPGDYPLLAPMRVMHLISLAGGLGEFVSGKEIVIIREVNGKQQSLRFNYDDVKKGRRLEQNIFLQPGDTVIVPD